MNKTIFQCLVIMATMLSFCPALAKIPTQEEIIKYEKKIVSHGHDLIDICKNLDRDDAEIILNLSDTVNSFHSNLEHMYDLLLIESIITLPNDKKFVEAMINTKIANFLREIDLYIKEINRGASFLKNKAALTKATELRIDIQRFKSLLEMKP